MFLSQQAASLFSIFSLFFIVICLLFNAGVGGAASISDPYPSDDEIRQAFLGVGPDETVLIVEVAFTRDSRDRFKSRYAPKKTFEDVFPGSLFKYHGFRTADCYSDFIDRCCRVFAEKSSGDVFLISTWPEGPSDPDSIFMAVEFPALRDNPNVRRIYLVDPYDWSQRIQYWPPDPDNPDRVETAPEDEAFERTLDTLTTTVGVAAGGLQLLQPVLGSLGPFLFQEGPAQSPPQKENLAPGEIRQDSFFVDTASLPGQSEDPHSIDFLSADALPVAGDATPLFTTIPDYGTDVFYAGAGDDEAGERNVISSTDVMNEPDSLFPTTLDDSADLFASSAKRQLMLYPRGCALRPGLERDLPFLFEDINIAAGEAELENSIPFPGALPAYATVHVLQRRYPGLYKLDIEIRNSAGEVIGSIADANAFANQRIEVQSDLPYRVQVWTQGDDDQQPLKFQYGPTGVEWDSNDSNPDTHDCHTDAWREDHREIDCKFNF